MCKTRVPSPPHPPQGIRQIRTLLRSLRLRFLRFTLHHMDRLRLELAEDEQRLEATLHQIRGDFAQASAAQLDRMIIDRSLSGFPDVQNIQRLRYLENTELPIAYRLRLLPPDFARAFDLGIDEPGYPGHGGFHRIRFRCSCTIGFDDGDDIPERGIRCVFHPAWGTPPSRPGGGHA